MTEAQPEIALDPATGSSPVELANAILWAAEHIGIARVSKKQAGTLANYVYWQWGRKHQMELLVELVPKAFAVLNKNKGAGQVAGMEATELEEVKELELLLDAAIAEAGLT